MSLNIRRAQPGEAGLVLSFVRELADYEKLAHEVEATEADIADALFGERPRLYCAIAEWNGEAVGFAVWFANFSTFSGRHGIYLEDLYVRPSHRGMTTKRLPLKAIVHELLWFLKGDTNIKYLRDNGVTIWDEWADANGDLGPVYGHQWRSWPTPDGGSIDQIAKVIDMIKRTPDSRRLIVTAWNPADVDKMALPPCHLLFQFYVANGKLSCQLYQRSADVFLGVPFNIASYALLTMMVAQVTGLKPGDFVHSFGDAHLYSNHLEQARLQLSRAPRALPVMRINPEVKDIFSFRYEDFELVGYDPHPHIKAEVAV